MNRLIKTFAVVLGLAMGAAVIAQDKSATGQYPAHPVRIILPAAAGTGTDIASRVLAEHLGALLGQAIVVDNRPGAAGSIGATAAARSTGDGYTLFMGTIATLAMNEHLYPNLGYEPDKDFEPIIFTGSIPMVVAVNPASPYKTLGELLEAGRTKPGTIEVALPSTTARVTLELLQQQTGTRFFAVPYNTTPAALTGVLGDQVQVVIDTVAGTRSLIQGGKLRALAVTSAKSTELLPGIASMMEQGVKDFEVTAWNVLAVPKGVSLAIKERLYATVQQVLRDPSYRARLLQAGFEPTPPEGVGRPPAEFIRAERARWGSLIKAKGIKP